MRLFGWTIAREKAEQKASSPVDGRGGWWSLIRESFAGAWQRNISINTDSVLTYSAVFACVTLTLTIFPSLGCVSFGRTPMVSGRSSNDGG